MTVRTHWVNGWFLRVFARPYVLVDDVEHAARWGQAIHIAADPGQRTVAAGARYRGTKPLLATAPADVEVAPEQYVRLTARNGPLNHQPFEVRAA